MDGRYGIDACLNRQCNFQEDVEQLDATAITVDVPKSSTYQAMNQFLFRIYGMGSPDECIDLTDDGLYKEGAAFEIQTRWMNPRDISQCVPDP